MQYALTDDAPFAVPSGAKAHYVLTISTAGQTLGTAVDITSGAAVGIPSVTDVNVTRYPKSVSLAAMDSTADIWVTVDGQTPVVGVVQPVGVKVPPTYPTLRIPYPAAIKADGLKFKSASAGGTPMLVFYEW